MHDDDRNWRGRDPRRERWERERSMRGRDPRWEEQERMRGRDRGMYLDEPDQYYTSEYRQRDWRDEPPDRWSNERWFEPRGDRPMSGNEGYRSDYDRERYLEDRDRWQREGYRRDYEDPASMRHVRTDYASPRPRDYDDPNRARDPRSFGYDPYRPERSVRYDADQRSSAPRGYRSTRGIRPYDQDWERGDPFGGRSYPDDDYEFEGHAGGERNDRTHRSDYDSYRYGSGRWGGGRNW
jgi:hypothetical protein